MSSLYAITEDFLALERALEEMREDAAPEDTAAIVAGWLEELEGAMADKADGCICYIRSQEAFASALTDEAKRLRERADVHTNRVKRIKEALLWAFEAQGLSKVETAHGVVAVQANGGKQALEVLCPVEELPAELVRVVKAADEEAIRACLASKPDSLEGVARLMPRGKHVRIK